MKKEALTLILLFSITLASAVPELIIQNSNQTFQPGETLLAELTIQGEFTKQISLNDIEFLEGRKKIFIEYDIIFYENTFYFYAYLNYEGNFTLKISDILYKDEQGNLKSDSIEQQIEVKKDFVDENQTITKILSIKPGFFYSSQTPAEFTLTNNGNLELNITYDSEQLSLAPEQSEKISITPNKTFSKFIISAYKDFEIPVIYFSLDTPASGIKTKLKSEPPYLHVDLITSQEKQEQIQLFNFGETNITAILISSDLEILEFEQIGEIPAKAVENLALTFFSEQDGFTKGNLFLEFTQDDEEQNLVIPIYIYAFPEEQGTERQEDSCQTLGGELCASGETCDGDATFASDGYCCIGTCKAQESGKKASYGWLWGLIILIILAVAGFFIFKKFRKTKPLAPAEKLKQTSKTYEKRIKGGLVRG